MNTISNGDQDVSFFHMHMGLNWPFEIQRRLMSHTKIRRWPRMETKMIVKRISEQFCDQCLQELEHIMHMGDQISSMIKRDMLQWLLNIIPAQVKCTLSFCSNVIPND